MFRFFSFLTWLYLQLWNSIRWTYFPEGFDFFYDDPSQRAFDSFLLLSLQRVSDRYELKRVYVCVCVDTYTHKYRHMYL